MRATGRRQILFASEMRPDITGNLLAVRDRMLARGLDREFAFHYMFRVARKASSLGYLRVVVALARADVLVVDDYYSP
mgnify:CR=1 FL=1